MALTLIKNPVGDDSVKLFSGFNKVEFELKREDLQITSVTAGVDDKAKVNHTGDLTGYLSAGDIIYLYSEASDYTYDGSFEIISIVAGEITINTDFIQSGNGGYINYFKNYYVEMQCVNPTLPEVNILPFSLQSDGDAAGNVSIDVTAAVDLTRQREGITTGLIDNCSIEFEVKYRQVYQGSSESFTLIDNKKVVLLYSTETPATDVVLNSFELPKIIEGYPAAVVIANIEKPTGSNVTLFYDELNNNSASIKQVELDELESNVNGFLSWEIDKDTVFENTTKYINFTIKSDALFDYDDNDYEATDYVTS